MQRYGSVIGIHPEKIAEYKRLHPAVWPAVLEIIKTCDISNYSIFSFVPNARNFTPSPIDVCCPLTYVLAV